MEQLSVLFFIALQYFKKLAKIEANFAVLLSEFILECDVEDEGINSAGFLDDVYEFVVKEYSLVDRVKTKLFVN